MEGMVEPIYSKAQKKKYYFVWELHRTKHHKLKIALAIPSLFCATLLITKKHSPNICDINPWYADSQIHIHKMFIGQ